MSYGFDAATVQAAVGPARLKLPTAPQRGGWGERLGAQAGSSVEYFDARPYEPGDDLRYLDVSASARVGSLILRLRTEEVSPQVEVILDASASMAVTRLKALRALEVTSWLAQVSAQSGCEVTMVVLGATAQRLRLRQALEVLASLALTGVEPLDVALQRSLTPSRCGVRLVVSDFLTPAAPIPVLARLANGSSALALVQVLDESDIAPDFSTSRLIDAESGQALDVHVSSQAIDGYQRAFAAHTEGWSQSSQRVGATFVRAVASQSLLTLAQTALLPLVERR